MPGFWAWNAGATHAKGLLQEEQFAIVPLRALALRQAVEEENTCEGSTAPARRTLHVPLPNKGSSDFGRYSTGPCSRIREGDNFRERA